jgi:hypothetical protein
MEVKPPFSRRKIGSPWIQDDFPPTARTALNHLLHDLVDRGYLEDWIDINKEIRRIARKDPKAYNRAKVASSNEARISTENILDELSWDKLFDFCERLYSHLASNVQNWNDFARDWEIQTPREVVQNYIADELQRIFFEENLAYSFNQGEVRQRGRGHTRNQISKAEPTLGDPRLDNARKHYLKAILYFEHPSKPDYENAVKEAVCAVEAAARKLFSQTKAKTLGEVMNRIKGTQKGQLSKPLADTIIGLYAYRNAGDGVSHGGTDGGKATRYVAEYAIAVAASQIILLHEVASENEADVPF